MLSEVCTFLYLTIININSATVQTWEVGGTVVKFSAGSSMNCSLHHTLNRLLPVTLTDYCIFTNWYVQEWPTLIKLSYHFLCLINITNGHSDSCLMDTA